MREIRIAGAPRESGFGTPVQGEALALFGRMTTPPSLAYREAVNWAIWRWKAQGTWALVKGLWILSADTSQAALLSTIGDMARDAQIVGVSPTFTPLKGFSGFGVGKQIRFPITSAILANDGVFNFAALKASRKLDPGAGDYRYSAFIHVAGGPGSGVAGLMDLGTIGNVGYDLLAGITHGVRFAGTPPVAQKSVVGGSRGGEMITAGSVGSLVGLGSAIVTGRSSNYITESHDYTPLDRLSAYGFLDAAATVDQCRKFMSVLSAALEMLGALD